MNKRRTKILATLGPSTDDPEILRGMIRGGLDVARLNFSFGDAQVQRRYVELVRQCAKAEGKHIGILGDLQGPKIRIEGFREGKVLLQEGSRFTLNTLCGRHEGTAECVGVSYKELPNDVNWGDTLLLDDGRIVLWVEEVTGTEVRCKVLQGGELSGFKGLNRQGGGLSAPALTDKDREDIKLAASWGLDYLGISFVRTAMDVHEAKELIEAEDGHCAVIAKIERAEALEDIDEIIGASQGIMIARGDLGVEIGDAALPPVQKRLIHEARSMNRLVITATQMMESMIEQPIPTRAEVFDVANAVLDGTDAVMLSAETAVGRYPIKVVEAMDRICREADRQPRVRVSDHRMHSEFLHVDESIAMATMYTANHFPGVKAIAALTESGSTPLWMSRISSGIPIYAMSQHPSTLRKATLFRGVYPLYFNPQTTSHPEVNLAAVNLLKEIGAVKDGDLVIITKGDLIGVSGTNAMKIVRVGDLVIPQD
ncbi:MAG: pyruvate kinase [Gammaproteobacteria bacterium]|nr:MAG: pyruvate kinase [Gammaproteobacteria bacterium]